MSNVVTRTRKRDVHERRVVREPICIEVPLTPLEREFYDKVTAIVRKFCQKRAVSEGFLLSTPQRQMSSCMPAALRVWQKRGYTAREYGIEDYDYMDTEEVFDERPLVGALAAEAGRLGSPKDLELHDSKYHALVECLLQILKANRSEKVILFSYFKATLAYLEERLSSEGISTVVLSGDSGHEKGRILDEFESAAGPNVLLSSEIGSEGIDLQFSRVVINYDLPWNPMRVEQRIGRVDRIGQRAEKVRIINLIYDETIDSRIYGRLFEVAPVGWTVWRRK
jgi:SNF2 family DNA or RNA helicase